VGCREARNGRILRSGFGFIKAHYLGGKENLRQE
jgi:hypothetical protein